MPPNQESLGQALLFPVHGMSLAACSSPGTVALDAFLLQLEIITAHICTTDDGIQLLLMIHASHSQTGRAQISTWLSCCQNLPPCEGQSRKQQQSSEAHFESRNGFKRANFRLHEQGPAKLGSSSLAVTLQQPDFKASAQSTFNLGGSEPQKLGQVSPAWTLPCWLRSCIFRSVVAIHVAAGARCKCGHHLAFIGGSRTAVLAVATGSSKEWQFFCAGAWGSTLLFVCLWAAMNLSTCWAQSQDQQANRTILHSACPHGAGI